MGNYWLFEKAEIQMSGLEYRLSNVLKCRLSKCRVYKKRISNVGQVEISAFLKVGIQMSDFEKACFRMSGKLKCRLF